MDGRILFDITIVQKGHNLESYKLDTVASHFMHTKIKKDLSNNFITVDTIGHLKNEDYISIRMHSNIAKEQLYQDGHKLKIININDKTIELKWRNINLNIG